MFDVIWCDNEKRRVSFLSSLVQIEAIASWFSTCSQMGKIAKKQSEGVRFY